MPTAPPRPCSAPGCSALVLGGGKCPACSTRTEKARGSSHERGYDRHWQKRRARFLGARCGCDGKDPGCERCHGTGLANAFCPDCWSESKRLVPATDVDHVIPHEGGQADPRFFDESNWRARCHRHHSLKTVQQDGGFGRALITRVDASDASCCNVREKCDAHQPVRLQSA